MFRNLVPILIIMFACVASSGTRTEVFENKQLSLESEQFLASKPTLVNFSEIFNDRKFCSAAQQVIRQSDLSLKGMTETAITVLAENYLVTQYPFLDQGELLSDLHATPWYEFWYSEVYHSSSDYLSDPGRLEKLYKDNKYCLLSNIRRAENRSEIKQFLDKKLIPAFADGQWTGKEIWAWRGDCLKRGGMGLVSTWAFIFINLSKSLD